MEKTGKGIKIILCVELAALTAVSLFLLALTIILLFAVSYSLYLLPASAENIGRLAAVAIAFGIGCQALIRCVRTWSDLLDDSAGPQETQQQGGAAGEAQKKLPKFNDYQKREIQHGRDFGLSEEQIALYARPELSDKRMYYIRRGLEDGLPVEQVKLYAKPELSAMQMREIWLGCGRDVPLEQIASYAQPELTPLQMQERRRGLRSREYKLPHKDPAQE